jgi:hypothetical protein
VGWPRCGPAAVEWGGVGTNFGVLPCAGSRLFVRPLPRVEVALFRGDPRVVGFSSLEPGVKCGGRDSCSDMFGDRSHEGAVGDVR